jgi:hypothetical protein
MSSHWLPSSVLAHDVETASTPIEAEREPWGWSEVFVGLLLLWNVVLFIPGAQNYRAVVRAMPYLVSGAALAYYFRQGTGERLHVSTRWLVTSFVLLMLNLLHETAHPVAGAAQIVFQICISAPAFWMARSIRSETQIRRVVWVIFGASAVGAIVGVLQVYFPARFMPPEFSVLARSLNPDIIHALTYVGADGREIIRPPGLSDLPGGAAVAGMMTMMLGLALAVSGSRRWVVRAGCAAAAVVGMTALYLTHVRSLTLVAAASVGLFAVMRIRQGRTLEGGLTLAVGVVLVAGSYVWALAVGGDAVSERFGGLANEGMLRVFQDQRGSFIRYTLSELLYEFPLGAGLGRWGMMQVYFGDPTLWHAPPIHVEVQLTGWLLDGGVPLWMLYGGALASAVLYSYRAATRSRRRSMQDIATILLCLQLTIICLGLSGPAFNTSLGILFWAAAGGLYGAMTSSARCDWVGEHEEYA